MTKAPDAVSTIVVDNATNVDDQGTFVNEIARRIRTRASELGHSQADVAEKARISTSTLGNYWNAKRPIPLATLLRIAAVLSTSVDRLLGSDAAGDLDLVAIGEIDLAYGMGGTFSDGPVELQTHHFPRAWVESITNTPPAMLTIARGRGDSMQPTVQDGDMVMIDRAQRSIREQDAIWALTVGDIAMIKRIRVRGEIVHILSDNDRVPPDQAHHEEVNVVGRVIFIGRKV
jgi:phage repressor protein C with HTH and peptisase S24 domain